MPSFVISDNVKQDILVNLIEPSYRNDVRTNLKLKNNFKKLGLWFETFSKFFVGVASVTSFASGIYKLQILSFLSGTASVVSLILLQYSSYSYRESKKITVEINDILSKLNITPLNDGLSIEYNSEQGSLDPGSPKVKK